MHDVFVPLSHWPPALSPAAQAAAPRPRRRPASSCTRRMSEDAWPVSSRQHGRGGAALRGGRPDLPDRDAAQRDLDLADRRVITLLGSHDPPSWSSPGHRRPQAAATDVLALFVRIANRGRMRRHRAACSANAVGVGDGCGSWPSRTSAGGGRVATDVALCRSASCRFRRLATWISAGRPIVTSDLAPFAELSHAASALHTFTPYEPQALARTIRRLGTAAGAPDPRVQALARRQPRPASLDRYAGLPGRGDAARWRAGARLSVDDAPGILGGRRGRRRAAGHRSHPARPRPG
jgi:hypothetical protein